MFASPSILWGLLAVGGPVLIHWLNRRRYERVEWAAMRFIRSAVQKSHRRLELQDLLLLLARCAIIALVVTAVARPLLRSSAVPGAGPVTAVVVLDHSGGMSATDGVSNKFDNAKGAVDQYLADLPTGSAAAVLLAADDVDGVVPTPTREIAVARRAVREAARSDRAIDLLPAIRAGLATLKDLKGSRSLVVVTDGRAAGWSHLDECLRRIREANSDVSTRVILVGPEVNQNVGVSDLRTGGDLTPADRPVRFDATITNYGVTAVSQLAVRLRLDDRPTAEEQIAVDTIAPGQSRVVTLTGRPAGAGFHSATVSVPTDGVPFDDSRSIAFRSPASVPILVVDGGGADFVCKAMVPVPPSRAADYFVKVKRIAPPALSTAKLDDYAVVVLVDVPMSTANEVNAIGRYVRGGGGVIVFPGSHTAAGAVSPRPQSLDGVAGRGDPPWLPSPFGPAEGDPAKQDVFFSLQSTGFDHPIAAIWNDAGNGSPGDAHVFRRTPLKADRPSDVVLSFTDGTPAVLMRAVGEGAVVQFATSADTSWTDLPVRPNFLPLLYRCVAAMTGRGDAGLNVDVGRPVDLPMPIESAGKTVTVTGPDGRKRETTVAMVDDGPRLRFDETNLAGVYSVDGGAKFAAATDPAGSSLEPLSADQRSQLAKSADVGTVGRAATDRSAAEVWTLLAIAALVLVVVETLAANRSTRGD